MSEAIPSVRHELPGLDVASETHIDFWEQAQWPTIFLHPDEYMADRTAAKIWPILLLC